MSINNKDLSQIRRVEAAINRNLYLLCSILTVLTMAVFLLDFFSRGTLPNLKIDIFYLGVLLVYSAHKELIRLMGKKNFWHHGEYFVYAWVVITIVLYVVNFATCGYYTANPSSTVLTDVSFLTLEVMGVFIISRALKMARMFLQKK